MKNAKKFSRREILKYGGMALAGSAVGGLFGCAQNNFTSQEGATSASGGTCAVIPSETAGPYPAHDDNAINVLRISGIEKADIRSSLQGGGYTGTAVATGVPLTLTLNLTDVSAGCAPLAGYVIYLWHCDINGKYSMYSSGITNETYLRGVQRTGADGKVTFTTIFPGCYDGRMTHIHFEVYPSLAQAVDDNYVVKTSQLTFPMATLNSVYNNVSAYSTSKTNLARTSYTSDNVFSDGVTYQMATMDAGTYTTGFTASMNVGIKA